MKQTPVDLDDVTAFARVVETGSFARAGERLGVDKSIISRRVARLEATLGAKLLVRSARGAEPTDVGGDYHRRLAAIFADLEAAHEAVAEATSEVAGPIRVTAPLSFGIDYLPPVLANFLIEHPRIELDLHLDDKRVDLVAGQYDLAVRIGSLPDSSLVVRKLAPVEVVVIASPAYLAARGRPETPADLTGHDALFYANAANGSEWRFKVDGRWERARLNARARVNNGDAIREMCRAGLGIAILPTFIAAPGLRDGSLEHILADAPFEEQGLYAVLPHGRASTARVRALVDHLVKSFATERPWELCVEAQVKGTLPAR
ncbi:LysR family transcriptional regulator [Sphingomonas naphthae]|uniref:LysR family transcriptional regulator n=1 Tax=Sphingomonas naphthae TaxID=1813468 RepID=A0ABY7TFI0_9SPHN|nr:LysR family transcriptional regulator [Sphingomonas naphthae]WCT71992.1 LysR family transcriptional regulator [Sphingomonas naphthae]